MENQAQLPVIPANQNDEVVHQKNFEEILKHINQRKDAQEWLKNPSNQVNALKYLSFSIKRNYDELKDEKLLKNSMELTQYNSNIANVFQYMLWLAGTEITRKKGDILKIDINHNKQIKHFNLQTLNESKLKDLYNKVKDWKKNIIAYNALISVGHIAETDAIENAMAALYNAMISITI